MRESRIQTEIRLALGARGDCVFWRNNVGLAHVAGRHIHYGLARGSADLIGIVNGRFCSLEIKTSRGRESEEQRLWAALVRRHGGFAATVRSVDEAMKAVDGWIAEQETSYGRL